ncbi:prepilin-type N-terminal cleavage/methylation domain-containing protein [Kribbella jejuensis]|uniref:Prepilin-type N-terminal cleavage/methylation domain-containing protein n=1 Tax=Kribbella jejuensis TaxID=236068 RepID=A0A542EPD5_9ACTN|nr:prepilin-type N-terminal cleavage/methylation domain-containing protein [Kribbella jejuensis]TQJ17183.1 prepilin-type N-terminal cleavage/methylation domain-containing protein [Kribbella jejuensis]
MLTRVRRTDDGFTLVELLVAVAILAVITVPLANVVIGAFRNTTDTSDRLALSHDAQISASYFARDVAELGLRDWANINANAVPFKQSVQLNAAYNAGGYTCGTSATPAAVVRLLSDAWDPAVSNTDPTTNVVAYYLQPVGAVSELHRIKCLGPATTPTADVVLAHNVKPGSVSVTCSSTCEATAVPNQLSLTFQVTKGSAADYPITLNGQRRQQ